MPTKFDVGDIVLLIQRLDYGDIEFKRGSVAEVHRVWSLDWSLDSAVGGERISYDLIFEGDITKDGRQILRHSHGRRLVLHTPANIIKMRLGLL